MTTTLNTWVNHCLEVARTPASFYAGARKIIRPCHLIFPPLDSSLKLSHAGFTSNKLKALTKHYLHEESRKVAVELWEKRRGQGNYGSVGFTTYNHFVKGDVTGATPRGSKFGPCPQSVVLTHINKRTYAIDVSYRTTELFKKFAPDLVLIRDVLLPPFDFTKMTCTGVTFWFANLTAHPMYWVTLIPHLKDPVLELEKIKKKDKHFYAWVIRWTSRYILKEHEHGIAKFSQALRVQKDARERIDSGTLKVLASYLRKNHPGYGKSFRESKEEEENADT